MGGNISKQLTDLTEKAVTAITIEFAQTNAVQISNNQEVVIENVDGDITIDDINLQQQVEVDVKQTMGTLSNTEAQTKLTNNILQESKQVLSGISLLQANYAETNMNKIVDVIHTFSSSVAQRCAATANQSQLVKIKGTKGSLRLKRLILSQTAGLISKCVQDAALSNTSLTELETTLAQRTDQVLEGINPLAFLGFLALGIVGGPLIAGGVVLSYLGPILFVAGFVVTAWAITQQTPKIELKLFSGLYNTDESRVDVTSNFYANGKEPTLDQIVKAFEKHAAYAFDLDRCCKKVYMYTSQNVTNKILTDQDIVLSPKLVTDKTNMRNGDLFYDKSTGKLIKKCNNQEIFIKNLTPNKTFVLENLQLKDTSTNTIEQPIIWPNVTNVSGWKTTQINKFFLFSGIITFVVGMILIIIQRKSTGSLQKPAT